MQRLIQEFSYPGITHAVPRYYNPSTFRQEWLARRGRLLSAWGCPVLILQGFDSKTQPREFYERAPDYIPNSSDVQVRYISGGALLEHGKSRRNHSSVAPATNDVGKPLRDGRTACSRCAPQANLFEIQIPGVTKMDVLHRNAVPVGLYPSRKVAWYACAVLTAGCILAFLDRGILSLFIVPIQRDLRLTDTQISLMIGLAFGVFNALFGLPVARWIDGGRRTLIAACGVIAWSLATVGCGLASNFWQLFAGRMGVGIGEATVMPSGVSLLGDLFPPSHRGLAMGTFYSGAFIGTGVALLSGGILWRYTGDRLLVIPLIGAYHSWQAILMGIGGVGFLLAPVMLLMREPRRLESGMAINSAGVPIAEVVRYYRRHARTLTGHAVGSCLQNFPVHAGAVWIPTLMVRTFGWSITRAGATYGVMMLVLGPAGSASAGAIADWLARRGRVDGKLITCVSAAIACALASAILAVRPSPSAVLPAVGCLAFFGIFVLPLAPGALQDIMPNSMRGQATAVYLAVINIVTGSLAATSVALLTDYAFHDKAMVVVSLGIVGMTTSCAAAIVLSCTLKPFRRSAESLAEVHLHPGRENSDPPP